MLGQWRTDEDADYHLGFAARSLVSKEMGWKMFIFALLREREREREMGMQIEIDRQQADRQTD